DHLWAVPVLQDAVRMLPEEADVAYDLARALYLTGRLDQAEETLRNVPERNFSPQMQDSVRLLVSLLEAVRRGSVSQELQAQAAKLREENAQDPLPALVIAIALEEQGKARDARTLLEQVTQQHPNFPPAKRQLALLLANKLGDDTAAEQLAIAL